MTKFAATLAYSGASYHGWQSQKTISSTLQSVIEQALSTVANEPVSIICAGRTDRGVHATSQVIHFETEALRRPDQWLLGSNVNLPDDIRLTDVVAVNKEFHARFSAVARQYCYVISTSRIKSPFLSKHVTYVRAHLSVDTMQQAARLLQGKHDFSAFRAASCQANTPIRTVTISNVYQHLDYIVINIKANAFLHHMVRNIAGALIKVGSGELSIDSFADIFESKDRTKAPGTADSDGLYLVHVAYPDEAEMSFKPTFPPLLQGVKE